ncbi:sodium:proton antiporter [Amycolatopsis sp. 195334CR]|uniref:cation:proton antiporter n=1 Tax=Amycolatopsis sp. 195334CR TaxID=2814588 RepID=UPI001A8DDB0A|nr:cation:proton antiporter [Amycolatopsis sp. 195334CR]MBN6041915.1 cation:proton antiporter [Amycolatopsis sp. 195334CR]
MELLLGLAGLLALAAALLPKLTSNRPLSMPLVLLLLGVVVGLLPLPAPYGQVWANPVPHLGALQVITEFGLIIALVGAGLNSDRVLGWRSWNSTWRLLLVAMPLFIGVVFLLGQWLLALPVAAALALAAALAPTDPVLASDVGVPEPHAGSELAAGNEVRFTLTTEAGLNDGLAMPFVMLAVLLAGGLPGPGKLAVELLLPLPVGVAVGVAIGLLLGRLIFRAESDQVRLSEYSDGMVVLAMAFLPFAAAELLQGNGFLAVFAAAVTLRARERSHGYHAVLHEFGDQLERLFVAVALLGLGVAIGDGLLSGLRPLEFVLAAVAVFVVRPLTGLLSLFGAPPGRRGAAAISFFGVRGIGTLFYVTYALAHGDFPLPDVIWRVAALAVALSVVVHGITAEPAMRRLERLGAQGRRGTA